jgi:hypothetical protein
MFPGAARRGGTNRNRKKKKKKKKKKKRKLFGGEVDRSRKVEQGTTLFEKTRHQL